MREVWTQDGGIDVRSKDGRREYSVEWDKDGKLVSESCVFGNGGKCKGKRRAAAPKQLPAPPKPTRALVPPGDWLAALALVTLFGFVRMCASCKSRRKSMNKAGWRGLPRLWWSAIFNRGNG